MKVFAGFCGFLQVFRLFLFFGFHWGGKSLFCLKFVLMCFFLFKWALEFFVACFCLWLFRGLKALFFFVSSVCALIFDCFFWRFRFGAFWVRKVSFDWFSGVLEVLLG